MPTQHGARSTYRPLAAGIGEAVAKRTILRTDENGVLETWGDVADRVSIGNVSLMGKDFLDTDEGVKEREILRKHIANASLLMSGRHLQHGDETQPNRNQEVFTNCATASSSFLLYYLLLNGSGVGRAYDDDLMLVDWGKNLPYLKIVLDQNHKDFDWNKHESVSSAKKKYRGATWFQVPDTREGWAKTIEFVEHLTFVGESSEKTVVLDFSDVRCSGSPIRGMQNRPAAGPGPTMQAFINIASFKGSQLPTWEQTMWVDHYLAESVLVGGARRSARMATKSWRDAGVLEFINVKKGGFLWSSNNSITVDDEFWLLDTKEKNDIFEAVCHTSYFDKTGEPGFINQHKLVQNDKDLTDYTDGLYARSSKYIVEEDTLKYLSELAIVVKNKKYTQITNPCGEISLNMLGGYCVIADVVPYFAQTDEDAEEAFRVATRSLIRVNTMDSLYKRETTRTNRIGVGMTGIHEYAWKRFGLGFRDLIDESKSQDFWNMLSRFKDAVTEEAKIYSEKIGSNIPHTNTTIKPAGTTSKLFALTEGAHLPAMAEYLRWVQFRNDDPLVKEYAEKKYPTKILKTYAGSTIVGFPTRPEICQLGMRDKLVTAAEATPEEQYKWLMLLEKYWIHGVNQEDDTGNQVSYTLKYKPEETSFEDYKTTIREYQSKVRCCSVMPQIDGTAYEYQPEEPITAEEYERMDEEINGNHMPEDIMQEDIDLESLKCSSGACPI